MISKISTNIYNRKNYYYNNSQVKIKSPDFMLQNTFNFLPWKKDSLHLTFGCDFAIKKIKNLPCPCCGKIMLTNDEVNKLAGEMQFATGKALIKGLSKYENRLPDHEKKIVMMLKSIASRHRDLTLDGLLLLMLDKSQKLLEKRERRILAEIEEIAKGLSNGTAKRVYNDINVVKVIISEGKNGQPFKRKILIGGFEVLRQNERNDSNREILGRIVRKAGEMPTSGNNINAFVVKYSRRPSNEIIRRLLHPCLSTKEHILPRSRNGKNSAENYLAECQKCNNSRCSTSYYEWLETHPEMITNVQKHADKIMNKIISGQLQEEHYRYLQKIKIALAEESEGLIKLDISKIDEYYKKQHTLVSEQDITTGVLA